MIPSVVDSTFLLYAVANFYNKGGKDDALLSDLNCNSIKKPITNKQKIDFFDLQSYDKGERTE